MSTTTALQGLPVPQTTDAPTVPAHMTSLAQAVEKKSVQVYASAAARTTAFSTAGVTATEGMLSWLQDVNRYEYVDNAGLWAPLDGQRLVRAVPATDLFSGVAGAEVMGYENSFPVVNGHHYEVHVQAAMQITAVGVGGMRVRYSSASPVTNVSNLASPSICNQAITVTGGPGRTTCRWVFELSANATGTWFAAVGATTVSGGGQTQLIGATIPTEIRIYHVGV